MNAHACQRSVTAGNVSTPTFATVCVLIREKTNVMRRHTSDGINICVNVYALLNPWIAVLIKHGTKTPAPANRQLY